MCFRSSTSHYNWRVQENCSSLQSLICLLSIGMGCPRRCWSHQSKTARGTQCPGLLDKVGIGQRWDSMILKVFSSVNDSVILSCLRGQSIILCGWYKAWCAGSGNLCFKISAGKWGRKDCFQFTCKVLTAHKLIYATRQKQIGIISHGNMNFVHPRVTEHPLSGGRKQYEQLSFHICHSFHFKNWKCFKCFH